jgi:predicted oxidoreductase
MTRAQLIYGTMGLGGWQAGPLSTEDRKRTNAALQTALDEGIRYFDLADIYQEGRSEELFGHFLKTEGIDRSSVYLQSKAGIIVGRRYDFSEGHLLTAVEGSLKRLQTDYLDRLILHRPDVLTDMKALGMTLKRMLSLGWIRSIGFSNMDEHQLARFSRITGLHPQALQLEMSLAHRGFVETTLLFNQQLEHPIHFSPGTLPYCEAEGIELQSWGSSAQGRFTRPDPAPQDLEAAKKVRDLARQKDCPPEAVVLAWLMTHPQRIRPIIGSTDPERIRRSCRAADCRLTRDEWYSLWTAAAGHSLP